LCTCVVFNYITTSVSTAFVKHLHPEPAREARFSGNACAGRLPGWKMSLESALFSSLEPP
jgi:hypothetical protein